MQGEGGHIEMEDLKMLGFQVLDKNDIAIQRQSRIHQRVDCKVGSDRLSKHA